MSLLHYVTDSPAFFGIRGSNQVIAGWPEEIRVAFIQDGYGDKGPRKNVVFSVDKAIRGFRAAQKRFRVQPDWTRAVLARQALCVFDYSALPYQYSYPTYPAMYYNGWYNIVNAMAVKIRQLEPERLQFLHIQLPSTWPSRADFARVEEGLSNLELSRWVEPGHFWIREVWNMLAGKSPLLNWQRGDETNDKVKQLRDVCFIFSVNDNAIVMSGNDLRMRGSKDLNGTRTELYKALVKLVQTGTAVDMSVSEDAEDAPNAVPKKASSADDTADFNTVKEPDVFTPDKPLIDGVPNTAVKRISELGAAGRLTAAEQNRLVAIAQNTPLIENPFKDGPLATAKTLDDMRTVTAEDLKVDPALKTKVNRKVVPAHALKSTTTSLTRDYIERGVLQKDIVNMLMMGSNSGVFIQDLTVEPFVDAVNNTQIITVKVVPVSGKASTWAIELPVVNPDGTFKADGVNYSLDTQKVDIPIRKVSPVRAALTSYMGKLFIQRSPIVRDNYNAWLTRTIAEAALNAMDNRITNQQFGENPLPMLDLPRDYTALMRTMTRFDSNGFTFYFNYTGRSAFFGPDAVKANETNGRVILAVSTERTDNKYRYLSIDNNGVVYEDGKYRGGFLDVVGRNWGTPPKDVAEILVFGKRVPIVFVLGYYVGLEKLLKHLKANYRTVPANVRISDTGITAYEQVVRFKDVNLVVDCRDPVVSMLVAGLNVQSAIIKLYNLTDFNRTDVYGPIFKSLGAAKHHLVELDLIFELFIDPITKEILQEMREPTDLISLMLKAVWLIRNDNYSEETDPKMQRRRGAERIAGFVYTQMVKAIREQRNKPDPSNHPVAMGPRDVWAQLVQDPTVQLVKELNPIHTLKEQEAVSLSGEGGRQAQTLVKRSRVFHQNDLGSISEATPDSGKVGIRTYMTANAKTKNLRGLHADLDLAVDGSTSCISTNALLLPCLMNDDPKRQNLSNIQQSACVPCAGYRSTPLRTGYEAVIASRLPELFVITATQPGTITKVTDKLIQITYKDGKSKGWILGRFHGVADGERIAHDRVTDMAAGDTFTEGDVIAWNKAFFERDIFSKTNVVMKTGALAVTVLLENNDTLEDGSRIGPRLKKLLTTTITKQKTIMVDQDQVIQDLVKLDQVLEYNSVLCSILDPVDAEIEKTDIALAALGKLSQQNPKAKFSGKVTAIEVFYNANIDDLSPSLKAIVLADNKRRKKLKEETDDASMSETGFVKRPTFIGGEKLMPGKVIITINIDNDFEQGVGDKAVFGNQLKTIHGGELVGENTTEDGRDIDAFFGYRSVNDRIVNSPIMQGTVNATLRKATEMFFEILGD
jgi:hypothetical protein